ncbi:MAG: GGDEF domain-containing protein [Rhodoferax sp.]|nr:GGDEF domain-containing protein [Rhodoferax sp.]
MDTSEIVVWSAMLGGLLTLVVAFIADVLMNRNIASWRGLTFVILTGTSCLLMTGLPELLLPGIPSLTVQILKSSLGPLSGALALSYLGLWIGITEDWVVRAAVRWGPPVLIAATFVLILIPLRQEDLDPMRLVAITAPINFLSVVLATVASIRAARLGDPLARWMVVACGFLAVMVSGLYTHDLLLAHLGLGALIFIAFSTVAFFLVVTAIGIRRNRQTRQLQRLAGLSTGIDAATGLPKGSVLLTKVDDAFWRSARLHRECTVICLHLRNLYELAEIAGHSTDQQILSTLAARMRRAVGFRNVVGLYHPRCFVVVISAVKQAEMVDRLVVRLRYVLDSPLTIVGAEGGHYSFTPRYGLGIVTVPAVSADPVTIIDQAERLALASELHADQHADQAVAPPTASAPLQAV